MKDDQLLRKYRYSDEDTIFGYFVPKKYKSKYLGVGLYYKLLTRFRIQSNELLVLCIKDEIVGTIVLRRKFYFMQQKKIWIYGVFIDTGKRGLGLGELLMKKTIDLLIQRKYQHILLKVAADNVAAVGLYRKLGFKDFRILPNYRINSKQITLQLCIKPYEPL